MGYKSKTFLKWGESNAKLFARYRAHWVPTFLRETGRWSLRHQTGILFILLCSTNKGKSSNFLTNSSEIILTSDTGYRCKMKKFLLKKESSWDLRTRASFNNKRSSSFSFKAETISMGFYSPCLTTILVSSTFWYKLTDLVSQTSKTS